MSSKELTPWFKNASPTSRQSILSRYNGYDNIFDLKLLVQDKDMTKHGGPITTYTVIMPSMSDTTTTQRSIR